MTFFFFIEQIAYAIITTRCPKATTKNEGHTPHTLKSEGFDLKKQLHM
jgi:hypothetical protein